MRFVIFSGTTEGRQLSRALADRGAAVQVCVATAYGREQQGQYPGVQVHTGRMEPPAMAALLAGAALCIDATHPYAAAATANIRAAAAAAGVSCRRLLRAPSPLPENAWCVPDAAAAAARLADTAGNILLATGAKELPAFAPLDPQRLYPRVLPQAENLAACAAAGIPAGHIIAMQGPFGAELNRALIHQFAIRYLVTKDGGAAGGFAEKVQAAADTGIQLVVIRRPPDAGESCEAVLAACEALLAQNEKKGGEGTCR